MQSPSHIVLLFVLLLFNELDGVFDNLRQLNNYQD